jgi:hypothetical protein
MSGQSLTTGGAFGAQLSDRHLRGLRWTLGAGDDDSVAVRVVYWDDSRRRHCLRPLVGQALGVQLGRTGSRPKKRAYQLTVRLRSLTVIWASRRLIVMSILIPGRERSYPDHGPSGSGHRQLPVGGRHARPSTNEPVSPLTASLHSRRKSSNVYRTF